MTQPTDPPDTGQKPRRFVPILPVLHLVHPPPKIKPRPKRRRHDRNVFTEAEQKQLRLALLNVRRLWTRPKLAKAMGCAVNTLRYAEKGRRSSFSAALAVRLARVTGISLDDILRPGLHVVEPRPGPAGAA